jgi:lanthionine synthetase-like protein
MRHTTLLLCTLVLWCAPTASARASSHARMPDRLALKTVRTAADSLVARHRAMPQGGWAWRSSVQAPHFQTDRDVGAASVGEGLLAAYATTRDTRYRRAAVAAGDFLLAVAEPAEGGLRWPDWADPDGERSTTHFTSFDDGAAGISDYLWRLFRVTHEPRFRAAAIAGMRWVVARAEGPGCPPAPCAWTWTDDPVWRVAYHGVGMGQAGVVLTLDAFADRTGDETFRAYARAGAAYLRALTANGALPLPRGSEDAMAETGFLSGSAGAAYVFLQRYARDGDPVDLATAHALLRWANEQPPASGEDAWGFELGLAGVAWVNLQAARATGAPEYREAARRAGARLRNAPLQVQAGVDSGTAGIAWVLEDLARAGVDPGANRRAARRALRSVRAAATGAEPSWHWGAAGVAAFAARLAGWSGRGPGGQSAP